MKNLVCILFVLAALPVFAQPKGEPGKKKEKIEQLKIAYLTKNLELSTEEAEKFWPIYNEMTEKMRENRKAKMKLAKDLNDNLETLKETEIKTKVDAIMANEQEELKLKKEYSEKIAGVIGYKKSVKLVSLERKFRQELKKELEKRREEGGPRPPGPRE